jgi:hypothetical protein
MLEISKRSLNRRNRRSNRGFAIVTALFIMGILLIVAVLLLQNAQNVAANTQILQSKNQIFDASEAGLDSAVDLLDRNYAADNTTACPGGTAQGYTFTCSVVANNFFNTTSSLGPVTDPVTGASVTIPQNDALIWGSSQSIFGGRTMHVEALVSAPVLDLQFPNGAINAKGNVTGGGHMPVYADPTDSTPNDATVHANGNVTSFTTVVQGVTYAVGTDAQTGSDGTTHSGSAAVSFPSSSFVTQFTNYAYDKTYLHGTTYAPGSVSGTMSFSGNTYIGTGASGSGNLDLTNGTYTFNGGIVFIDGYLCLSGHATIVNKNNTIFVIRGQYASAGNSASYNVASGTAGQMVVLGTDSPPSCAAADGSYAFSISGNGSDNLGTVFTPNGSAQLAGNGNLTGALETGVNAVLSGGGSGGKFTYDHNAAAPPSPAPANVKILSYGEYSK